MSKYTILILSTKLWINFGKNLSYFQTIIIFSAQSLMFYMKIVFCKFTKKVMGLTYLKSGIYSCAVG